MATSSSQTSEKEKADIEETTEVAKSVAAEFKATQTNGAAAAVVTNNRGRILKLYATHSWNGSFQSNPAESISVGGSVQFLHFGSSSRGAVIYGEQREGSNPAGYLLAWSMLNGPLRVYVKCGPLAEVHSNGWETAALANLNSSGVNSTAEDNRTSSRAVSQIRDDSGTFPLAVVGAVFG